MVVGIPGDSRDCPQRDALVRTYGPTAWKRSCDVIVTWNGTRLIYKALLRD
jgi:hypothetical protein